jgi:hypothetical protein
MARKMSVDDLYGGRSFPRGRVRGGSHHRIESEPSMESASARDTAFNRNTNQAPEDFHDSRKYDNDVADDWRRGGGPGGATSKPSFDKSGASRQADGSIHGPPGNRGQQRRPEPVTANKKQMRDGG